MRAPKLKPSFDRGHCDESIGTIAFEATYKINRRDSDSLQPLQMDGACHAMVVAIASAYYAANHFQINTRTRNFISKKVPWRQDMIEMDKVFPQGVDQIVVVVDGKTMELAEAAAQRLSEKLQSRPELFRSVERQNGGPFFDRNALLFMPLAETRHTTEELSKARPILVALATDPSLRGIMNVYSVLSRGIAKKTGSLDDFDRPITALADTLDDLLSRRRAFFSWRSLLTGETPSPLELRQIISVKPILDYEALQPGKIPTAFIRNTAKDLGLRPESGVRVRLTGPVPLADEEYSAIEEGATLNRPFSARRSRDGGWVLFLSPDRLCRSERTWPCCWHRHVHRLPCNSHGFAGSAFNLRFPKGEGMYWIQVPCSGRPFHVAAPVRHHYRHSVRCARGYGIAFQASIRLESLRPISAKCRSRRHFARFDEKPADESKYDQYPVKLAR
jgi:hypothetical protein